ncbi:zinc finger protein 391 [Scaptodrosophila lebanonensis]|uniref:Zinc finger protein 391 n=1 Tax=Drosophila lebanonensis TaxID=7225 RepID=A0A6J2TSV4_DROLE|nr:zinc finger protein 391 [Scaptodrosophila lebanonensis]
MIKLEPPSENHGAYYNFRCGEVVCIGPATYNVCCALCGQKITYESFPQHFRLEHLSQSEEDCKLIEPQAVNEPINTDEQQTIKVEDDPIAHETYEANEIADLARIAQLDGQLEVGKTMTRRRRAAALKNTLVRQQSEEDQPDEAFEVEQAELATDVDWEDSEGSTHALMHHFKDGDESSADEADMVKDMLFPCDECDRAYSSKRSLQSHKRSKHSNKQNPNVALDDKCTTPSRARRKPKGPAKVHKCNECDQTFRTERDLRGHRWKHTGIFCDICGKPFSQSGNMTRHRQRHSGIKPYKCQECDATFYTQKELTSHNICHTGRMPCICEVCGRPCRDRGVLTAHMRRHTGERPAKCDVCGKAFYSFHDLNVHAVSHTNLRPFVCDICGSTFQRKKALRVHKLLHSEQRKYACKLCSKTFAQSGGLNAHMRTHESPRVKMKTASTTTTATGSPASAASGEASGQKVADELLDHPLTLTVETDDELQSKDELVTISMDVEPASWHV